MYLAALTLDLLERGEIALDDPIGTLPLVLPETLQDAPPLTPRQLLSHVTGLTQSVETLSRTYAHWLRGDRDVPAEALSRMLRPTLSIVDSAVV
jgi:CubicO group peptidase (beta-lactamase class C family)